MVPNGSDLSRSDFCSFVLEALSTNGRDVLKKTLLWDKLQSRKKKTLIELNYQQFFIICILMSTGIFLWGRL